MIKKFAPYLLVAAVASITYFSFEWAIGAVIHSRRVVSVPEVTGKAVTEALNLLSQARLGIIKEGEQFDKRYPAGTVVRQTPPAGMMVREGRLIKIIVSQGGETIFVPDMLGQPLRNAQTTLQNAGLSIGEIEKRPSLRFPKEQVMMTDPPSGSVVSKNALVNVIVSEGPPGSDVQLTPDFVGKNVQEAKKWAASHDVTVTVREESDLNKGPGEVILQAPNADAPIRAGDTLTVVANTASGGAGGPRIRYVLPADGPDRDIRILVVDESGEREVFRKAQTPGSRIDLNVTAKGRARARILSNGILVEEQEIQ